MEFVKEQLSGRIVVELTRAEISTIADIGLEVTSGSLNISESQWQSALLPVSKSEARALFDELRCLLKQQRQ